jgi:DHA1 family bicyclomycin/chloramphenicol resistance-like MFS transporter
LVYLSTSSFAFQTTFKISPQLYSIFFAVNAIGIVLITQVNRRLLLRYSPANLLRFGCGWGAFWTSCLVIYSHLPNPNLYVTAGLLVFVMSVIGFVLANGISLATYHHADRAGTASGYFGAGQTFIGSIFGITSNLLGASMRAMSIELVIPMLLAAAIVIPLLPRYQPKSR